MTDIKKVLEEKKPIIDKIIEKYIPRKFDNNSLEFVCGKPRYEYNTEAPTKAISEPIWEFLDRGGKRWRPALFLLVVEALGGDTKKYMNFVLLPEILHNGSIIIDDIEDMSETRRGLPSTYITYGIDVAVNVGNAMYFLPMLSFLKNKEKFDNEILIKVFELYIQEMINIHFGQAMDIAWHKGIANADSITEKEYLQMCAYKTGTLARLSAKMAAILVKADEETIEKVGRFAESIGVAFQIQDDIINLTSEEYAKIVGYKGFDITEGKRTLMVIHTLEKANPVDKKRLIEILNMHTKDQKLIQEAIDIIRRYGSIEYAKKFARGMIKETWAEIDSLLKPSDAKEKLKAFVDFLVEREY